MNTFNFQKLQETVDTIPTLREEYNRERASMQSAINEMKRQVCSYKMKIKKISVYLMSNVY